MAIWLGAWSGDNAGPVVGRQANRLLVSLTHSDGTFPPGIFEHGTLGKVTWYYDLYVTCLTPGARDAIAVSVDKVGDYVWSVELAEVDWEDGKSPWEPGIHLFSAMLLAPVGHQSGVIGTAVIDDALRRYRLSDFEEAGQWRARWLMEAGRDRFRRAALH